MKIPYELPRIQIAIFTILVFLNTPAIFNAQTTGEPNAGQAERQNSIDQNILRWEIFLGSVAQDAKTAFPEERRVYPTVEAANAYWEFDPDRSRTLYISAMDTAISLTRQDKKYRPLINHILSSSAKRDPEIAKLLSERLLDAGFKDANDIAADAAMDLVESDPETAARLAETFAPNGLRFGAAVDLIFRLARKDIRLSDRVYNTYLNRVATDQTVPLDLLLYLSGYSFGYTEFFSSVGGHGDFNGRNYLPIVGLHANPAFINSFLSIAYQRTAATIEIRNRSAGEDIAALNYPIIFAFEYLMPEIARFAPSSLNAWQQLQQQGMAGTTPEQISHVRSFIQQINAGRLRVKNYTDSSQTPEKEAEASLKDVEKLPGTCQRDIVYSQAAILFSSRKNFKRAIEINEKIEGLKQRETVNQTIRIDMSEDAIKNGDPEAQKNIERIIWLEHKAILFAMLADATGDRQSTEAAAKLADKFSKPDDSAGLLFALSAILLKIDPAESQTALSNGIRYLNKAEPNDDPFFLIPLKVPYACDGDDKKWHGGFSSLPNSTIFTALATFAQKDPDAASRLADDIGDKITKLRAQAMIAKIALSQLKLEKKNVTDRASN